RGRRGHDDDGPRARPGHRRHTRRVAVARRRRLAAEADTGLRRGGLQRRPRDEGCQRHGHAWRGIGCCGARRLRRRPALQPHTRRAGRGARSTHPRRRVRRHPAVAHRRCDAATGGREGAYGRLDQPDAGGARRGRMSGTPGGGHRDGGVGVARTKAGLRRFRAVRPGSRVALVAPASGFDRAEFDRGVEELRRPGLDPVYDDSVFERRATVAGAPAVRAAALAAAWAREDVDAIVSVRGGYGSVEILPILDRISVPDHPAGFVGYSDLTSLHTWLNL